MLLKRVSPWGTSPKFPKFLCVVFCLVCCAGCLAVPTAYYQPGGDDFHLWTHYQFQYWCADEGYMRIADYLTVWVQVVPSGRGILLNARFEIGPSKKWFELAADELQVCDRESNLCKKAKIDVLKERYKIVNEVDHKEFHEANERIEINTSTPFLLDIKIPDFRPRAFTLELPSLIIDGQRVDIPPITFQHKRGVRLYTAGQ